MSGPQVRIEVCEHSGTRKNIADSNGDLLKKGIPYISLCVPLNTSWSPKHEEKKLILIFLKLYSFSCCNRHNKIQIIVEKLLVCIKIVWSSLEKICSPYITTQDLHEIQFIFIFLPFFKQWKSW